MTGDGKTRGRGDRVLHLLRHAKSAWDQPDLVDVKRGLDPRGVRATAVMAAYLEQIGLAPGLVICSPAIRARRTWEGVRRALPHPRRVIYQAAVYEADRIALSSLLREVPDDIGEVLVVGHDPGLRDLALWLTPKGSGDRATLAGKFPTAALASLHLRSRSWNELAAGTAELIRFVAPKHLV